MKCFYHNDLDGECSAAIVKKANLSSDIEFIEMNYNKDFPFDIIEKDEEIVIVDFSLQKEGEFERLLDITSNVVWIDHHRTAIEKHKHLSDRLKGLRINDKPAGCELTWRYYYGEDFPVPLVVKLIGDFDTFTFKYGEQTRHFQYGIQVKDTKPESGIWSYLLTQNYSIDKLIDYGDTINIYLKNYYKGIVESYSFETTLDGYSVIACNIAGVGSFLFESIEKEYDIMSVFVYDGTQYTVSLYSKKDDINCGELAKKYGGGGHPGAAGFQTKELPFETKLSEK